MTSPDTGSQPTPVQGPFVIPVAPVKNTTVQNIPVLVKPSSSYTYQLTIPAIKVNAPVKALGLTSDGKMAVPDNFTEVAWYSLGTTPGQNGNAVMAAHVDNGSSIPGVFKHLSSLKIGDDIYVTDTNGATLHFRVNATKVYDYRTTDTDEVFGRSDAAHLNFITCHGTFMPALNTYNERLVVFTELVR